MSEIRDKVIGDIIDIVFTNRTTNVAHEIADQILSIPSLAVVDRKAGLPKNTFNTTVDDVNRSYPKGIPKGYHILLEAGRQEGYELAQQDMLKAGWVKEVKIE